MRRLLTACFIIALLPACRGGGPASGSGSSPASSQSCGPLPENATTGDGRPVTIPALRQWRADSGFYVFSRGSRIVTNTGLQDVARTLADDLAGQAGFVPQVVSSGARSGDIVLASGSCGMQLGEQGYALTLGSVARITAPTETGVFYGTRTLLQLLHQDNSVPAGEARDWPRYPERGLMVDVGREYFPPDWIRQHIRQLAYYKLNYLHLHFSDDQGFRIESTRYPEIVSAEHLSKAEVRDIVALARRYHIEVVPEIDMPGHMGAVLAAHPEFALRDILGQPGASQLDITNEDARQFARNIVEELLPLFPGRYWHIGGDEYMPQAQYLLYPQLQAYARAQYGANATTKDAIHDFENWIAGVVQDHGKIARMWHDDLLGAVAVTVDPDIVVEWWSNVSPLADTLTIAPQTLLNQGHSIMNAGWFPNYYTVGVTSLLFLQPDMQTTYESWTANQFYGPAVVNAVVAVPPYVIAADEPRNLGSKLNIWTDNPPTESPTAIAAGIHPRLPVLAQKYWESPLPVATYAGFLPLVSAVGDAPGYYNIH